jgi:phage baseplate assembly protein W
MFDIDNNTIISFDYGSPENEEIARNLATLYSTVEGTIPMDRDFGLSLDATGYPLPVAKNMIALEITEKTETYEPRVEVLKVTFIYNLEGKLIPNVLIGKADDTGEDDE